MVEKFQEALFEMPLRPFPFGKRAQRRGAGKKRKGPEEGSSENSLDVGRT